MKTPICFLFSSHLAMYSSAPSIFHGQPVTPLVWPGPRNYWNKWSHDRRVHGWIKKRVHLILLVPIVWWFYWLHWFYNGSTGSNGSSSSSGSSGSQGWFRWFGMWPRALLTAHSHASLSSRKRAGHEAMYGDNGMTYASGYFIALPRCPNTKTTTLSLETMTEVSIPLYIYVRMWRALHCIHG